MSHIFSRKPTFKNSYKVLTDLDHEIKTRTNSRNYKNRQKS